MKKLRVLDLFSGLGGWSQPFKDAGHDVIRLDINPKFGAELTMDILEFAKDPQRYLPEGWVPDVILTSPDCRGFSVASIGVMWETATPPVPKHDTARLGIKMAEATMSVLEQFPGVKWAIENPRGMMTNWLYHTRGLRPFQITYCKYGMPYQKPTRIWHNIDGLFLRPSCRARPEIGVVVDDQGIEWTLDPQGKPCHHRAERSSSKGVQGLKGAAAKASKG